MTVRVSSEKTRPSASQPSKIIGVDLVMRPLWRRLMSVILASWGRGQGLIPDIRIAKRKAGVGIFRGELRAGNGGGRARENSATNCAAGSIVDARESADRPLLRQDEQKAVPTKDRVRRDR